MNRRSAHYYWIAVAFCVAIGLYDVLYVIALNFPDERIAWAVRPLIVGRASYPDFTTPYAAVQAYFTNKASLIYDPERFTAFVNELYGYTSGSDHLRPFLYPPVWLLMLLPFGLLPVGVACLVFMVTTALAAAFAGKRDPWTWLAVATSPAAVWTVLSGQNTFLYVALMYGGMQLVQGSPVAAGILLGFLVYKPQICLLVPLALLAGRQWKALACMIGTGAGLVAASVLVFGVDFWIDYVELARSLGKPPRMEIWTSNLAMFSISPFVAACILHWPSAIATAMQVGAAGMAVVAVWYAFRWHPPGVPRTAILMAGTLLMSPYALYYDLLLVMPAAVALYRYGMGRGFYPGEPLVYAVLWLMPSALLWFNTRAPITPLVVLTFGSIALARLAAARPGAHHGGK